MSTEIVPAENVAALEALPEEAREVAITGMLDQARTWLAHAVESTAPAQDIANFKAYIATAAETTKRLRVSKEIQQDAEVMVRRTERTLGQAIRRGQECGEIARNGERASSVKRSSATDFASNAELSGNGTGIYAMTDDVSDDEFEEAIDRAQEEKNVSRANVVRKVREVQTGAERQAEKWDRIADLAASGHTSRQIAELVSVSPEWLRASARKRGLDIPADQFVRKSRHLDSGRILRESATQLEGVVMAVDLIDPADINPEEAQEWVDSLTASIRTLSKAVKNIKESIS